MELKHLRNIGIAAHIDAGKTTLTERILFYAGVIHRAGDVDSGNTTTDYEIQEQERGITITSAAVSLEWTRDGVKHPINLIDTPGHVDFTIEVERSLRVLDGAIAVFSAVEGVQAQSETVWRQATKYGVPRLAFINKMDRLGADFERTFNSMRQRLADAKLIAVQMPIGAESNFVGVIDLIRLKARMYAGDDKGTTWEEVDVPEEYADAADAARTAMIEQVAELDDALTEKFLGGEEISQAEIRAALRKGTIALKCQPVFCGSALKYKGVQALLDAVADYLPSPLERPPETGADPKNHDKKIVCKADPSEPLAALAFKIIPFKTGDLTFLRVYSGTLKSGSRVLNPTRDRKENVSRLVRMFADDARNIESAGAGDIVAVVGLKDTLTGDSLCDQKRPVLLGRIDFPETVVSKSIEPETSADKNRLADALAGMSKADPTFKWTVNPETGEVVIRGMGELHLIILTERLTRQPPVGLGMQVRVGRPKVSYRETITSGAEVEGRFIRQMGGRGHYAVVKLRVEPAETKGEEGVVFVNALKGVSLPKEFLSAAETGVKEAARTGVIAGYPLVNVKATLVDAQLHEVDSSDVAFNQAAYLAFNEAVQKASPILLEPYMRLEVTTPDQYLGSVQADLNRRGAEINNVESRADLRVVQALAPLSQLFGYEVDLRSASQGRAASTMEFAKYAIAVKNPLS